MKYGFITNAIAEQCIHSNHPENATLTSIADWAVFHGFDDLECGPSLGLNRDEFESVLAKGNISALETLWWMPHFMVCSIHFELLVKSCQMEFRNHEFYSLPRVWLC